MSMISRIRSLTLVTALVGLCGLAGFIGCGGSSTNNDQGTSFLAFGYFAISDGSIGLSGVTITLAGDIGNYYFFDEEGNLVVSGAVDGGSFSPFIGLQNRLSTQFIRVVRIDCSYDVPGANPLLSIPDDSYNSAFVITSSGDTATNPGGPTVPGNGGSEGTGGVGYLGFQMISTDILSYLNVNRNLLPKLPFRMNVSCQAVGVTQAGDTIVTNPLVFPITFADAAECCTGAPGFQGGTGNGGGITFDDGTSTGSSSSEEG